MTEWQPIETAPFDKEVLIWDGFGVVCGAREKQNTLEEWWETVGLEGEKPDAEGYEQYLEETNFGWRSYCSLTGDEMDLEPTHWMPLPTPPADTSD